ncbi:MAG: hypothetical protein AAFX85_06625, partial [Pseudomonadota bacterium]
SAEQLAAAEGAIDGTELLELAGLIKLIVEEALVPVPEGSTSLMLLTADGEGETNAVAIQSLLQANGLTDADGELLTAVSERLQAAVAATLEDDALAIDFDAEALVGTIVRNAPVQPGWVTVGGEVFDLAADGTGSGYPIVSNLSPDPIGAEFVAGEGFAFAPGSSFIWSVDDNGDLLFTYPDRRISLLQNIDLDNVVEAFGFDEEVADFLRAAQADGRWSPGPEELGFRRVGERAQILLQGGQHMLVRIYHLSEYDLDALFTELQWPGELPVGVTSFASDRWLRKVESASAVAPPGSGDTLALPLVLSPRDPNVSQIVTGYGHDVFTLQAGGVTTAGLLGGDVYDWRVEDNALVFTSPGAEYRYRFLTTVGDLDYVLVDIQRGEDELVRVAEWAARAGDGRESFADQLAQALPTYWQTGINLSSSNARADDGRIEFSFVRGYVFREDGASASVSPGSYPQCIEDAGAACFFRNQDATWSAVGTRIVQTQQSGSVLRRREWEVLGYTPGGRAVVLEWVVDPGIGNEWAGFPNLNTSQLSRLDAYPDAWEDALNEGFSF